MPCLPFSFPLKFTIGDQNASNSSVYVLDPKERKKEMAGARSTSRRAAMSVEQRNGINNKHREAKYSF